MKGRRIAKLMNIETNFSPMHENELILAALLHDIGKFWQRSGTMKAKHQELSRHFIDEIDFPTEIDVGLISTLVLRHHDREDLSSDLRVSGLGKGTTVRYLARIVSDADNISSAMDRETDEDGEADHPLISVFSEVGSSINETVYKPEPLSSITYPETSISDITDITVENWNQFLKNAKTIGKYCISFDVFFHNMYYLLKRHTTLVLSAGYRTTPDISLFDHLKTTSAIALCLFRWKNENKSTPSDKTCAYLLIEGDLSGIQRFIFQIASPDEARAGMSKRLRGRSFWLTLMMDAIATKILKELNLPETNLLWNTGGHFLILAPNTETYIEVLEKIRKNINEELLNDYNGNLFVALNWVRCSAEDLKNFSELRSKLALRINASKQQKFIDSTLNFNADGENRKINDHCVVCGDFKSGSMWFKVNGDWKKKNGKSDASSLYCNFCKKHEELGGKLAKFDYIIKNVSSKFNLFGTGYDFVTNDELSDVIARHEDVSIYKLNDTDFLDADLLATHPDTRLGFKFLGNTVPQDSGGNILSFEYLAQMSKGANKLGVLKADVDDLGKIFAFGLKHDRRSISRIHALSAMLELFFAGQLNEICKRHYQFYDLCESCSDRSQAVEIKERNGDVRYTYYEADESVLCSECREKKVNKLYITYSGGDDLLIIGPYDAIIKVASDIRREFKRFTCENPEITISCGIAVVDPHYPVARTVLHADEQLELAKSHMIHGVKKNNIALFNECVRWDESKMNPIRGFETIFNLAKDLEKKVEKKELSKGFIYSLLKMWHLTFGDLESFEGIENSRGSGQFVRRRYMPYLKYQLMRTIRNEDERHAVENLIKPCMDWIKIPVSWVSLRTRK